MGRPITLPWSTNWQPGGCVLILAPDRRAAKSAWSQLEYYFCAHSRRRESRRSEGAHRLTGDKPSVSQVALIRPLRVLLWSRCARHFWPDWIEALTGYDLDQHAGLGGLIVIAL